MLLTLSLGIYHNHDFYFVFSWLFGAIFSTEQLLVLSSPGGYFYNRFTEKPDTK